jgi:hypothetical protein
VVGADQAARLASMTALVEKAVASMGQRLGREQEHRLESLRAEINARIDELVANGRPPADKTKRRSAAVRNGPGQPPPVNGFGLSGWAAQSPVRNSEPPRPPGAGSEPQERSQPPAS